MTSLSGKLLGLVVLATMLAGLAACSPGSEKVIQRSDEDARQAPPHRKATAAPEGATATGGETAARTDFRAAWDYVALGDSLAVGVGARRGYVDRYAEHLRSDTGAQVRVVNLGLSGQTSSQLLSTLGNDPSIDRDVRGRRSSRSTSASTTWGTPAAPMRTGPAAGRTTRNACARPLRRWKRTGTP